MQLQSLKITVLSALLLTLGACAALPSPQTQMQETNDLAVVVDDALQLAARYGESAVLVVFDIDNTLLAMEQGLGSDQWYEWQKALQKEDPCSGLLVSNRLAVQGALYFASAMRPTQPDAAQQLRRLQDADMSVIALTSRGADFRLQTFRELRRNGYSFWPSALPPQSGYPDEFIPAGGTRPARYEDGVFLTAGQHKGDMLKALLDKTGVSYPKVVVVADDKERNLQMILESFEDSGTSIHAWRYNREDENVATLNYSLNDRQWKQLRPALQKIQQLLGPDNFNFPDYVVPDGCGTKDPGSGSG
jgi:hypothetical protein